MSRIGNMLDAERRNFNAVLRQNLEGYIRAKRMNNAKCAACGNSSKFSLKDDRIVCGMCSSEANFEKPKITQLAQIANGHYLSNESPQ